jgi:hypothetical protein
VTEFRQSGSYLTAWVGETPLASISWEPSGAGWYINFIHAERPALLAPLLASFRAIWRNSGKPRLEFHARDTAAMRKLVRVLGAVRTADSFEIPDLGSIKPQKEKHHAT